MNELHIPKAHVHKLLCAKNPDAALLYLYLTAGNAIEQAEQTLQMSQNRVSSAGAMLRQLGLWEEKRTPPFSRENGLPIRSRMCFPLWTRIRASRHCMGKSSACWAEP